MRSRTSSLWYALCAGLTAALAVSAPMHRAMALDINLFYDAENSSEPIGDFNGAQLQAIMQAAASYWETVIRDNHTIDITYRYETPDSDTAIASAEQPNGDFRTEEATIRFRPTTNWYWDPTPFEHSEFNVRPMIYADVTAGQQGLFNGSVPSTFEVAYMGGPLAPEAFDKWDILTTALHEIGHTLGMSYGLDANQDQVDPDGDYDFNPDFVRGHVMSVDYAGGSEDNLKSHIAPVTLMNPSGPGVGNRALPGATDVLAMASVSGWTDIDLPNRHWLGGTDWNNPFNWLGNKTPNLISDVYIQEHMSDTTLTSGVAIRSLTIARGAFLKTDGFDLFAVTGIDVRGFGSALLIHAGSDLMTPGDFRVFDEAGVDFIGGTVDAGNVLLADDSLINGYGTIRFTTQFRVDGTLRANGGTLTIISDSGQIDLDGFDGMTPIDVELGDLTIDANLTDSYSHEIAVSAGRTLEFSKLLTLADNGVIRLIGSAGTAAQLRGGTLDLNGSVIAVNEAVISAGGGNVNLTETSNIQAPDTGDVLHFTNNAVVFFGGGTYGGDGRFVFDADVLVLDDVTLDVRVLDWDGVNGDSTTTVDPDRVLTINSERIENAVGDGFDGVLQLNGGVAMVNTVDEWRMEGTLNLRHFNNASALLGGQDVVIAGQVNVQDGEGIISPSVTFEATADVNIPDADDILNLGMTAVYQGGSHTGAGTLEMGSMVRVEATTTLDVATVILDRGGNFGNLVVVEPAAVFTINADAISENPAEDGFDGILRINGATAIMNVGSEWRSDNMIDFNAFDGPNILQGSTLLNHGNIEVHNGATFVNSRVEFHGMQFDGVVDISEASFLNLTAETRYYGGTFVGAGDLVQTGDSFFMNDLNIQVAVFNLDGIIGNSTATLMPGVQLNVLSQAIDGDDLEDAPGEQDYDGTMHILAGATLLMNIPFGWTNDGVIHLDSSFGAGSSVITGNKMTVRGEIHSVGFINAIDAEVHFDPTAAVTVADAGDSLQLLRFTTYAGGSYTGQGTISQFGDMSVIAPTVIDVDYFDWDGGLAATPSNMTMFSTSLTINAISIENPMFGGGYSGTATLRSAHLTVNTDDPWRLDGTILMIASTVSGQAMVNTGLVTGSGLIDAAGYTNDGQTISNGATLTIATAMFPDLDGAMGAGALHAIDGDLHVTSMTDQESVFAGQLNIAAGHEYRQDHHGLHHQGTMLMGGGSYVAPSLTQNGYLFAGGSPATLATHARFVNLSQTIIDGTNLIIDGSAIVDPGASITGEGTLIVLATSLLGGNGQIDTDVINQGVVNPGESAGNLTINADFSQVAGAELFIELGGAAAGEFDHLTITSNASFAGAVTVKNIDGYIPLPQTQWVIGTYLTRIGEFTEVFNKTDFEGLLFSVTYDDTQGEVILSTLAGLGGDVNLDGKVNITDLSLLATHFGQQGPDVDWADGDFNGDHAVTISDLSLLATFFGSMLGGAGGPGGLPGAAGGDVPEPASAIALTALAAGLLKRRRRRRANA